MIWHSASAQEVLSQLQSDPGTGLTEEEAHDRLSRFGLNKLTERKRKSFGQRFLEQLKDFMVIVLMIAAAVSFATNLVSNHTVGIEPIVIILIVILNALLGVLQESKAEAALDALRNMAPPKAKALRDGVEELIPADRLVPGDIIRLETGDLIPADARLLESVSLRCEESALTGESVSAEKSADGVLEDIAPVGDRSNMIYAGCSIAYGHAMAVVCDTGMNTEVGKIATVLGEGDKNITPLQSKLNQLGKTLGLLALIICGIIFVFGMIFTSGSPYERFLNVFMTSVSLAVAAIPEGLAAIVTVVLAIGVQRMVKKNAIIRSLPAVETLGSASIICTDKTGTLTQNRMTLTQVYNGHELISLSDPDAHSHEEIKNLLLMAAMCCDGTVEIRDGKTVPIGDPTETGIVAAAMKFSDTDKKTIDDMYPRTAELPFDSDRKLMTTVNMIDGVPVAIVKGAPDILLSRCIKGDTEAALKANEQMAKNALRVLGVAYKPLASVPSNPNSEELEHDLIFGGLLGMIDPPREEVKESLRLCRNAGIRVIMITGDHVITAEAIARQLGIMGEDDCSVTGEQLSAMSETEFRELVSHCTVYARVSPEDKIRIVKEWQRRGKVVAMTGDGVNDAPALKAADIGCAMGMTGTDVAKGAADMTLTDDNFATIVTAVSEGRGIFDNIRKAVQFLLGCNLGEVATVFLSMLIWHKSPLLAIQLLWINLVTDGLPALALGMEPPTGDVMNRVPRERNESVFAHGLGWNALWQGAMFAALTLGAYAIGLSMGGSALADTMAFAVLAFSQLVHSFNMRSSHSIFGLSPKKNPWIFGAFACSAALMLIVLLVPPLMTVFGAAAMTGSQWLVVALLSLAPLLISELVKVGLAIAERKTGGKLIY